MIDDLEPVLSGARFPGLTPSPSGVEVDVSEQEEPDMDQGVDGEEEYRYVAVSE